MPISASENAKQKITLDLNPNGALDPNTVPVWTVSAVGIVTLFPSTDGLKCVCVATAVGNVVVTATATAAGVVLTDTCTLTVTTMPATTITITAETPVSQ